MKHLNKVIVNFLFGIALLIYCMVDKEIIPALSSLLGIVIGILFINGMCWCDQE